MKIGLAWVRQDRGVEAVLRGVPDELSKVIIKAHAAAGGGRILCEVAREVGSQKEENELWLHFIQEAAKVENSPVVAQKHKEWSKDAGFIWQVLHVELDMSRVVCYFMKDRSRMFFGRRMDENLFLPGATKH